MHENYWHIIFYLHKYTTIQEMVTWWNSIGFHFFKQIQLNICCTKHHLALRIMNSLYFTHHLMLQIKIKAQWFRERIGPLLGQNLLLWALMVKIFLTSRPHRVAPIGPSWVGDPLLFCLRMGMNPFPKQRILIFIFNTGWWTNSK
jgi:hypothetical protein